MLTEKEFSKQIAIGRTYYRLWMAVLSVKIKTSEWGVTHKETYDRSFGEGMWRIMPDYSYYSHSLFSIAQVREDKINDMQSGGAHQLPMSITGYTTSKEEALDSLKGITGDEPEYLRHRDWLSQMHIKPPPMIQETELRQFSRQPVRSNHYGTFGAESFIKKNK